MKNKFIWIGLSLLLVAAMLLVSCAKSTTTSASTSTSTSTTKTTSTTTKTITTSIPTATSTTATATGNWWDSLGIPQYGGDMVMRINRDIANFDPINADVLMTIESAWMERLFASDWTLDPAIFAYKIQFTPNDFEKGQLAESWEFTDPSTLVVHLRQGIYWQNIPPANGREFTADDVVFHYDRLYGWGDGFNQPSSVHIGDAPYQNMTSITTTDQHTVVFKWKINNPEYILETLQSIATSYQCFENPEAVKLWGDVNDWHHAIGTGPFILQDFVSSSSATLIKNPNYWGYDERYPQNKLPYINTFKVLIIPDNATALAALRTGKIDAMDGISLANAQGMQKTSPEILQIPNPATTATTVDPRIDVAPFKDIRVREAMQMAINLPEIAKNYYGGVIDGYPQALTSSYLTGWGFPYTQWPQDLKDEYAYNPTAAKKLLADAGYATGFNTDIVADNSGDMDLLQIVKSNFAAIGINMDIRTMDSASWVTFVQNGHKQDQLAQRVTGSLGQTYEPLRDLTRFQAVGAANWVMVRDPVIEDFYTKGMAAKSVDEAKKVLRDANEYVARQHFVISLLQPVTYGLYQPWLKGYSGQLESISGSNAGATMLYFYPARFWIDQKLKHSMGH